METILRLWRRFPNQDLLGFAATSFLLFFIAEFIAAAISGSLSLLADAAAMAVDVATYGCNMMAERIKERDGINSRKARVMIEVIIPGFAIMTLFGVTIYFTWVAVGVLQTHEADKDDNVNIVYLYAFSSVNFVIDVLCIGMFYFRGSEVFLERRQALLPQLSLDTSIHSNDSDEFGSLDGDDFYQEKSPSSSSTQGKAVDRRNLNMISAFAHMGGDSLRTVSVLAAALISTLSGASVDLCDAWAAIVVSGIIVLFMLPLVVDIARACWRLTRENQDYERLDDRDLDEVVV